MVVWPRLDTNSAFSLNLQLFLRSRDRCEYRLPTEFHLVPFNWHKTFNTQNVFLDSPFGVKFLFTSLYWEKLLPSLPRPSQPTVWQNTNLDFEGVAGREKCFTYIPLFALISSPRAAPASAASPLTSPRVQRAISPWWQAGCNCELENRLAVRLHLCKRYKKTLVHGIQW